MNVKQYFSDLKSILEHRNEEISNELRRCRTEAARITGRYSEAVAGEELSKLERDARANILSIDQRARDAAEKIVQSLRGQLAEHISGATDPGLLAQLQTVQSFNLHLTRSEIEAMAAKSNGNPVALAALAQAAERSNFQVNYTTVADLEADLKKILSLFAVPSLYAPNGYENEALQYSPDEMRYGVPRRPDIVSLTVRMKSHQDATAQLDEMGERWSDTGKITLKELAPV